MSTSGACDGAHTSHTLFPFLFSFTHTHAPVPTEGTHSQISRKSHLFFLVFYTHIGEINLPLNSVIKNNTPTMPKKLAKTSTRTNTQRNVSGCRPQERAQTCYHTHTHTFTCIKLQRVTSPKTSCHVCDVPRRTNSRPKWKPSCFFLITWKERREKKHKAINLAGCKTCFQLD